MISLEARMAKYTNGQITWPALTSDQKCAECRHFQKTKGDKGRCGLVLKMHKIQGVTFDGTEALACGKFDRAAS